MKSDTKEVGKNTLIYGLGNALNKLLGFILIPIYTSYITIEDFGILAILETSVLALIQLLNYGIVSGHQRYYYKLNEDGNYGSYLFTNYFSLLILGLLSILPLLFLTGPISTEILGSKQYCVFIYWTLGIIVLEMITILPFQILQFDLKPIKYILLSFCKLFISLLITVYLVIYKQMGIEGILIGRFFGLLFIGLTQFFLIVIPRVILKFNFTYLLQSIRFGFPIIFSSIGFLVFSMSDIYMLNALSTKSEVGMYSFGYKIANFINLIFIQSLGISYLPSLYKAENKEGNSVFYSKMLLFYVILISIIVFLFILSYKFALNFIIYNDLYSLGLIIVPIISLSFIIKGMNNFTNVGILIKNKTNNFIIPSFVTAIVNIFLNFFLIPIYGFIGAAISTLISQILYTTLLTIRSNKIYPVKYAWNKIFLTIIMLTGVLILDYLNPFQNKLYFVLWGILLFVIFTVLVFKYILNQHERNQLTFILKKAINRQA